jgi:hypothetical protein
MMQIANGKMGNWLRVFIAAVLDALLGWGQKQAEKPRTADDAQTPDNVKRDWNRYTAERLRNKPDGVPRQPK